MPHRIAHFAIAGLLVMAAAVPVSAQQSGSSTASAPIAIAAFKPVQPNFTYGFDAKGRVTSATPATGATIIYSYPQGSNRPVITIKCGSNGCG